MRSDKRIVKCATILGYKEKDGTHDCQLVQAGCHSDLGPFKESHFCEALNNYARKPLLREFLIKFPAIYIYIYIYTSVVKTMKDNHGSVNRILVSLYKDPRKGTLNSSWFTTAFTALLSRDSKVELPLRDL